MSEYDIDIGVLSELPEELKYLIDPAMKYGIYQFNADIDRFLDHMTDEEEEFLTSVLRKYDSKNHYDLLRPFMKEYCMTEHKQVARLYFLFSVLDAMDG